MTTTAVLSIYSIIITIVPVFLELDLPLFRLKLLSLGSASFAVFILVLSLLEAGNNYQLRAERLHDAALQLGRLQDELKVAREAVNFEMDYDRQRELYARYHTILSRNKENHLPIDYQRFRTLNLDYFPMSLLQKYWIRARYWTRAYMIYVLLTAIPPLLFVLLFTL